MGLGDLRVVRSGREQYDDVENTKNVELMIFLNAMFYASNFCI